MAKFLIFEIPGVPIAKARHKSARRGNILMHYDPQHKEKKWMQNFIYCTMKAKEKFGPTVALQVDFNFFFTLPKSATRKQKNLLSWGCLEHMSKPDCTNLGKFYEDVMNEIVYPDDKQLVSIKINKFYSVKDRTIIKIMPKKDCTSVVEEIIEKINIEEFFEISHWMKEIAQTLMLYPEMEESTKLKYAETAALAIKKISENYGKVICEIAKKNKTILNRIEKDG